MEFRLRDPGNGVFEIVQFKPIVIGSFADLEVAEKVLAFFKDDAESTVQDAKKASTSSIVPAHKHEAPTSSISALEPEQVMEHQPPQVVELEMTVSKRAACVNTDEEWTDAELEQAFMRREAGEGLKSIAEGFGKNMRKLQGKWAVYMRRQRKEQGEAVLPAPRAHTQLPVVVSDAGPSLVAKVTTVIEELKAQVECVDCGKRFVASQDNWEKCARCSR